MGRRILALFLSCLTNNLIQLQGIANSKKAELRLIFDFLSRHSISSELSIRIKNYVQYKQKVDVMREEGRDDEALKMLPVDMRRAAMEEVRASRVNQVARPSMSTSRQDECFVTQSEYPPMGRLGAPSLRLRVSYSHSAASRTFGEYANDQLSGPAVA